MKAQGTNPTERDDRVQGLTRGLAYFIVPFLLVAAAVLYPWPSDTGRLFAWEITSTTTAMVLGAVYLGGAYFFLRASRATAWHTVKGGFIPVGLFASLMGVATIVHWDKFHHSHVAFWLWAGLYFTTPFLVFLAWFRNRRHDGPRDDADLLLPVFTARLIAGVGALSVAMGLFLFLVPDRAIAFWPWTLTPLTARVLGAIFCLGVAGMGVVVDRRWGAARVPLQVAGLMLTLILVAGVRGHAEFDPANVLTWTLASGFGTLLIALGSLYSRMEARRRSPVDRAKPNPTQPNASHRGSAPAATDGL
jgi:hypothetical protein